MNSPFRARIYQAYNSGRQAPLAPSTPAGLAPRAPYLKRLIRDHFPADRKARILDLGCGYGALLYFCRQAGYTNAHGVDGSAEQVAAARHLGIEGIEAGDLVHALAACAPESIDCLVTFDVIEHFSREELLGVVDGVHRALRTGGRWIIHVPNGESPFAGRMRYWDLTHELAFTHTSLSQLLYASGFAQVRSYEEAPVPHGLKSTARWLGWQAIRAALRVYLAVETGDLARDAIFTQNLLAVARK